MFEPCTAGTTKRERVPLTRRQGVDMKTAATPMTATRPRDLDELQDAELLTMAYRALHHPLKSRVFAKVRTPLETAAGS